TLSSKTFYEVTLQRMSSKYRSRMPNLRDESFICPDTGAGPDGVECEPGAFVGRLYTVNDNGILSDLGKEALASGSGAVQCFGGASDINGDGIKQPYCIGEEPLGFSGRGNNLLSGESIGSHWNKTRDTSDVQVWTGRFDLTSQLNRFLQLQTGAELMYSNYDMHYAQVTLGLVGAEPVQDFPWNESPIQGGAYAQTKLEFKGMIANIGARLDYFDANTSWWDYSAYDPALAKRVDFLNENLPKEAVKAQVSISPRIGISFPITVNSKLYFNYGHFRQMLNPSNIFGIQQSKNGGVDVIGNPRAPMPKTVAYELGFDQNLFNKFLLRISGFYRDVKDESRSVSYFSLGNEVTYDKTEPWHYRDIRGFELSLTKNRGRYFQGFANFTYTQTKSGNFGYDEFHESTTDMQNWLRSATDYRLSLPVAEPYARVNLIFLSPKGYGPTVAGAHPLGDWRLSLLGEWRQGQTFTWFGTGSNKWVRNNVRYTDYTNVDLRLTKQLNTPAGDVQLFADVSNLLNTRYLYRNTAFVIGAGTDFNDYMQSLHLDGDTFSQLPEGQSPPYTNIPGGDKPGDYRKDGVAFQPIKAELSAPEDAPAADQARAWVWAQDSGKYYQWQGSSWTEVPSGDVKKVLDNKAYIDMPNITFTTFLNPRRVTLGIRYTF
ncbi:MAG TPA: TonB-dependent receptor, partial [Rhodothermales bacterium]|nr:TonB-dependent receptor [Rhodothermales bacterium]